MTRNPYRTALGVIAVVAAGIAAVIWLVVQTMSLGAYRDDPALPAWAAFAGSLTAFAAVALLAWLVVCAVTYQRAASNGRIEG